MKKIRRTIIIISLVLCAFVAAVTGVHFMDKGDDSGITEPDSAVMDGYLIDNNKEKSPERVNAVMIKEGVDGLFVSDDNGFLRSLTAIKKSFFDWVYIEAAEDTEKSISEKEERLSYAVSEIKKLNKKAAVIVPVEADTKQLLSLVGEADGAVLTVEKATSAEDVNLTAGALKESKESLKVIVSFDSEYEYISSLDKKLIDEMQLTLSLEGDGEKLASDGKSYKIPLACSLDMSAVNGLSVTADVPLKNLYAVREMKNISTVVFSSLKKTKENFQNSFGAVKTYISSGIMAELAFREIGMDGYNGEVITVDGYIAQPKLCGSYLFPFFIDGKNVGTSGDGNLIPSVDLKPGENSFTVKQNGSSFTLCYQSACNDELVRSITPAEDLYLLPGESFRVTVIAHCNAEVYIKFGLQKIQARCEKGATGYTAFTATVTAPMTEGEISSVGSMNVIASYGEKTVQTEGVRVFPASTVPETTAMPQSTTVLQSTSSTGTTVDIGNYTPTLTRDEYAVTQGTTSAQNNNNSGTNQNIVFNGDIMCVVKEPYADTKLLSANNDYAPFCSPLAGGTMDYVVAESTYFNPEDEVEEYYYDLASGRKIKQEFVDLVSTTGMGDNTLEVLSVISGLNKLQITLKTKWRVPYNIDYPGQNYYYSYTKKYNVSSFTADTVRLTFYHTASASGSIDVNGSNVLSSATWSTSASDKTATLTFGLKNPGEYYGSSLEYDKNGNMVITVNRKPDSSTGYVVLLDPGHGGAEPGAVGLGSAVQERQINLEFALLVKQELEKKGVTVYLTRAGNDKVRDTLSLEQRKVITRSVKPDLYVSIHCNGSYNPDSIGTSTYYYEPFSYNLAKNIYGELLSVHKNYLYAGRQDLYSQLEDKVQFYPFNVTRVEDCPSTLIEVGYLTNDGECAMLAQPENKERFGRAIADGIYKTLTN